MERGNEALAVPYLVLVISLHDDDGRVGLDVFPAAVNENLIKHHQLVPGGRQSFLNDLTENQTSGVSSGELFATTRCWEDGGWGNIHH